MNISNDIKMHVNICVETEAKNVFSRFVKLTDQLLLKLDFQKVDKHTEGKIIHGLKNTRTIGSKPRNSSVEYIS